MLVQLVRIHACHAWGHGFESRTHRKFFVGTLTEWLGGGLQNRIQQFESAGYLHTVIHIPVNHFFVSSRKGHHPPAPSQFECCLMDVR